MAARLDHRSDADLLRAAARDPQAFGVFYDRHADAVLAFFARRTADAQTAADLTAETFAQAFASRRRYRDTGAPASAWLYAIARHQLSYWLRREAVEDRGASAPGHRPGRARRRAPRAHRGARRPDRRP